MLCHRTSYYEKRNVLGEDEQLNASTLRSRKSYVHTRRYETVSYIRKAALPVLRNPHHMISASEMVEPSVLVNDPAHRQKVTTQKGAKPSPEAR